MLKRRYAFALLVGVLFSACQTEFKQDASGLQYRFLQDQKAADAVAVGDILLLHYQVTTTEGKVLEEVKQFKIQLAEPAYQGGAIEDGLKLMHAGDSALFLLKAADYFEKTRHIAIPEGLAPEDDVHFYVKLLQVTPRAAYEKEKEIEQQSYEMQEEYELQRYLKENGISQEPSLSGLYIIHINKGKGSYPTPGKKVTVHYTGSFLNGEIFDSSVERDEPFVFTLGVGEVIPGWDEGLAQLHVGEKAQLIIPSHLAYGTERVGPIPPYSTLIFDVEVLKAE